LITDVCRRYGIPADTDHIKPHSFFKATQCPGTLDVTRIITEVAKKLVETPAPVKIDLGVWGKLEVQAIVSTLNDMKRDLLASQEKGKQLDGFISKWVEEWKLTVGSNLVELEAEMAKLMPLEETAQTYRDSIESCVGTFDTDKALLESHKAVRTALEASAKEIADLAKKLDEAKTPVGYKFIGSWDFFSHRYKHYKKI
jgi:hypothetical protein